MNGRTRAWIVAVIAWAGTSGAVAPADETAGREFFETKIRPVLVQYCYECHSAAVAEPKGGLRLDSREGARRGGETGPAVVPGQAAASLLLDALKHESLKMPPGKKLPPEIVKNFENWIRLGAVDPRDRPLTAEEAAALSWEVLFAQRKNWWSLQPLKTPKSSGAKLALSPERFDGFIAEKLRAADLSFAPPADPTVLLRRMSFVLTGLPPTPEQAAAFETLAAADVDRAVEKMLDELLASPHFGERFARHWMDVIRYSDTYGYEWDIPAKGAWRYRDYLIRAFNGDLRFDEFVREQLAGDLLPLPRINAAEQLNESLIGPMFFHLGEHRHGSSLQFQGIHQEMLNNKIDAFSKAFLGTTVACARCHDHKLDAVSQRDYYALASVFMTPRWVARCVDAPGRNAETIAELKRLRDAIHAKLKILWLRQAGEFEAELEAAFGTSPADKSPTAVSASRTELWRRAVAVAKDASPPKPMDVDDLGPLLADALADEAMFADAWSSAAAAWKKEHETRTAENAKNFVALFDRLSPGLPEGWSMEGDGMLHGRVTDGTPRVALAEDAAVAELLPAGFHTHALSPRLPGAVYSNRLQSIDKTFVSLQIAGGDWASPRYIVSNALLSTSEQAYLTGDTKWQKFGTFRTYKPAEWTYRFELATASLNPNFPGPTYLAKANLPPRQDGEGLNGWFSVTGIVKHNVGEAPQATGEFAKDLFDASPPDDRAAALRRIAAVFAFAVERWRQDSLQPGDVELLNWLLKHDLLDARTTSDRALAQLTTDYRAVERRLALPRTVVGMDERGMTATNYVLDLRGNYDEPGPSISHDFLEVFAGKNDVARSDGSGRLELAEFLTSARSPLTARVYVNRVWQWVFGVGLVATPDDFGHLGEKPSHPELLDALAADFIADGWSTKRLLRKLLLSRTFRQSGQVADRAREVDPNNRLWHHYPTRRLEAEALRDSLLATSGRLDPALYGPPIDPPRAKEDVTKRLFSGPLDGAGRRSIYTKIALMEPPKFLVGFNLPDPKLPTGRRDVTNVPTQALALLNDPFVRSQAEHWAERLVVTPHVTMDERLQEMFVTALGRRASPAELKRWNDFLAQPINGRRPTPAELLNSREAWVQAAHLLFNTKEFLYYR